MKISSRFDYGLSCILRVADRYGTGTPVSVGYIARKERIASDYVEQLLIKMKREGLLKSVRGPAGGYILNRAPNRISVKDVAEAIERELLSAVCSREKGRRKKCAHSHDCRLKSFWAGLKKEIEVFLKGHTLRDLLSLRKKEKNW